MKKLHEKKHEVQFSQVALFSGNDQYAEYDSGEEDFVTSDGGITVTTDTDKAISITVGTGESDLNGHRHLTSQKLKVTDNKFIVGNVAMADTTEFEFEADVVKVDVYVDNKDKRKINEVTFVLSGTQRSDAKEA